MRQKIEAWLEHLSEYYERLRVSYLVALALLIILLGSLACSAKPTGHQPPMTPSLSLPTEVTKETKNPLADLAAASQAGKPLYETNCSFCHGVTGASDGTFVPKPPVLDSGKVTQDPDGELFLVIKNGKGKAMPAMKRLTDEQIWQIVAYVRTLAKK